MRTDREKSRFLPFYYSLRRAGCTDKKQKKVSNNWEEGEEVVRAMFASPMWWFKRKEAVGLVFAVSCVHRGKHRSKMHHLSSFLIPHSSFLISLSP